MLAHIEPAPQVCSIARCKRSVMEARRLVRLLEGQSDDEGFVDETHHVMDYEEPSQAL